MMDFFMGFFGPFLQAVELSEARAIRKSEAISALRDAIRYTRKHIDLTRVLDIEENYDDQASELLAEKWALAAKLIRPFDYSLANTLEIKAEYWINPNGFKNDIQNGNIHFNYRFRLNYVISDINRLERKFFS